MKLFIWERVDFATTSWHDEGGIVVIAESLESARAMIASECPDNCEALTTHPDWVCGVEYQQPKIIVFPDAGCC